MMYALLLTAREDRLCHEECKNGCWGPGNTQCKACRNSQYQNHCLKDCTGELLFSKAGSRECQRCHTECKSACSGPVSLFAPFFPHLFRSIIMSVYMLLFSRVPMHATSVSTSKMVLFASPAAPMTLRKTSSNTRMEMGHVNSAILTVLKAALALIIMLDRVAVRLVRYYHSFLDCVCEHVMACLII